MPDIGEDKPRVLMLDDDADFQTIVGGWLAPRYEHVALKEGEDIVAQLAALDPDLLILDVRMPGANGFDLCARVRADGRFYSLPILFLTGAKEGQDFVLNLKAGGTALLMKPVAKKRLLAVLRELLPDERESIGTGD
jgi:DNA-binding response OmpR family regulator